MHRWSQLLQSFFVIFGCCLELLGLLLVCKLLLHIHSPEPHGRDFCLTAPASRERRTPWGFPGYQPLAGDAAAGRALEFAAPVPQTRCSRRSPRSDTPSPDCLRLTHSLVLVQAERGGGGGVGEKPSKYPERLLRLRQGGRELRPCKGGGAGGGGAERARSAAQAAPGGARRTSRSPGSPRRFQGAESSSVPAVLGNCCGNTAI